MNKKLPFTVTTVIRRTAKPVELAAFIKSVSDECIASLEHPIASVWTFNFHAVISNYTTAQILARTPALKIDLKLARQTALNVFHEAIYYSNGENGASAKLDADRLLKNIDNMITEQFGALSSPDL